MAFAGSAWLNCWNFAIVEWLFLARIVMECISKCNASLMAFIDSEWLNCWNFVIVECLFLARIVMECISKYKMCLMTFIGYEWRNCWNFVIVEWLLWNVSKYNVPLIVLCNSNFRTLLFLTSCFGLDLSLNVSLNMWCHLSSFDRHLAKVEPVASW